MTIYRGSDDQALDLELRGDEKPLCSEEEFAPEVREFVAYEALRVFALVEAYGERADGRIVTFHKSRGGLGVNGGLPGTPLLSTARR